MCVTTRFLALLTFTACSSPRTPTPVVPDPPTNATTTTAITNTAPPSALPLEPYIHAAPIANENCELAWEEHLEGASARIELTPTPSDECLADDQMPRRLSATMRGGVPARLTLDGPGGSGRFWALDFSVGTGDHERYACIQASTVGFRMINDAAKPLAPLPWLEDIDQDGTAELIVWDRLPWGQSEVENALFPVVYVLDGDALVRRDDRARVLFDRVAAVYRARAKMKQQDDPTGCLNAVAAFLESTP